MKQIRLLSKSEHNPLLMQVALTDGETSCPLVPVFAGERYQTISVDVQDLCLTSFILMGAEQ